LSPDAVLAFPPPDVVGRSAELTYAWTERDVLLYALGVGAGQADPGTELELTTENSVGHSLRPIPTFGVLVTQDTIGIGAIDADPAMVVHAEQALRLHRPLPTAGAARVSARVTEVLDKGSGALVVSEANAADAETGEALLSTRSALFVRGAGGFDGRRPAASAARPTPAGAPTHRWRTRVRADQALLYRLSGDRNPLHSDPTFAARAGFEAPILHGLATFGITGRILFTELCRSDPERFQSIRGRFTAPVRPGQELIIAVWDDGGEEVQFRTETGDGVVVLDHGRLEVRR
jgi:acyl dehydratase